MNPTFTPLTPEQYQSARTAGFSPDQILQNEQIRKSQSQNDSQNTVQQSPKDGVISSLIKDPIKTLFVKPADRFAEAVGRTGILGQNIKKGYEEMSDKGEGRTFAGITVEPQKSLGQGGASQIAGDALKSAAYLAPAGKIESAGSALLKGQVGKAIVGGATSGAVIGGFSGAGEVMGGENPTPGKVIGGAIVGGVGGGLLGAATGGVGALAARPVNKLIPYFQRSVEEGPVVAAKGMLSEARQNKVLKDALDVVSPKLTKTETENALAQGRGQTTGILGRTEIKPDKHLLEVADATKGIVERGKSGAENIQNVRGALSQEADSLIQAIKPVDHPYDFQNLTSDFDSIEKPIAIKSDTTLNNQYDLAKNAALQIAQKNKGTVSGLLNARKDFDALVQREFPTLYDRENAPMRNAITSMRNTMNNFIEKNLPQGVGFRDSLKKQTLYYDAIDNIAGKSSSEVGGNALTRFAKNHPTIKNAIKFGVPTIGGYEGLKYGVKKIFGD